MTADLIRPLQSLGAWLNSNPTVQEEYLLTRVGARGVAIINTYYPQPAILDIGNYKFRLGAPVKWAIATAENDIIRTIEFFDDTHGEVEKYMRAVIVNRWVVINHNRVNNMEETVGVGIFDLTEPGLEWCVSPSIPLKSFIKKMRRINGPNRAPIELLGLSDIALAALSPHQ